MPRRPRYSPGGLIYHVLNRGVGRMTLFSRDGDYLAFLRCLADTLQSLDVPVLGYCLMPNHWHLILWPQHDGQLAAFMQRLTITHVRRWLEIRHAVGTGHVYQDRYRSFVTKDDGHLLTVCRYVERNPLRAGLVQRAEDWAWSSLPTVIGREAAPLIPLAALPIPRPEDWLEWVNLPQTSAEEAAVRKSITTGRPLGDDRWRDTMCRRLGVPCDERSRGRPRKDKNL